MSDKIKPHHLERKAILYVRQSSAYQVQNNLESQKLQYAMETVKAILPSARQALTLSAIRRKAYPIVIVCNPARQTIRCA